MKTKIITAIALTSVLLMSCKKEYTQTESTNKKGEKHVRIQALEKLSGSRTIIASGKLSSKQETILSFKTGGIVQTINVEEGDAVSQGKLLAQLNLSEINAQVISAENSYHKSIRDLERTTLLYQDTVATLEQKQNAETAKDISASQLQIAKFNRQYSTIVTPIKAHILKRFVEKGELVSPGQPIFKIGSSGTKGSQIIRVGLADADIVKLRQGDKATIQFDAFPKKNYKGQVIEIAQTSNSLTGLFDVEIAFSTYSPELKNGFIGKIEISPSQDSKTYRIPMSALVEGNGRNARIFYTQNKELVKEAIVVVDDIKKDYFSVSLNQIPDNAYIITSGAPYLKDNDSIKIRQ